MIDNNHQLEVAYQDEEMSCVNEIIDNDQIDTLHDNKGGFEEIKLYVDFIGQFVEDEGDIGDEDKEEPNQDNNEDNEDKDEDKDDDEFVKDEDEDMPIMMMMMMIMTATMIMNKIMGIVEMYKLLNHT